MAAGPACEAARAAVLAALLAGTPAALAAQGADSTGWALKGYSLSLGALSRSNPFSAGGGSLFQRARLMVAPTLGAVDLDLAYDLTLLLRSAPEVVPAGALFGAPAAGAGDWLPLQGTLLERGRARLADRLDRLSLGWRTGALDLRLGRQPISWATTLLLTPADPFAPFDPSDPFREFRAGVDAARLRIAAGAFTELELVARLSGDTADGIDAHQATVAARAKTTVGGLDLSLWGGALYGEAAGALGAVGTVMGAALRGEAELRRADGGGVAVRAAAGADRRLSVAGRDLHLVVEYQHDDFGADRPEQLASVLLSPAAARGELQVLGRDVALAQAGWQMRPLLELDALVLADVRDHSLLAAPALAWSLSDEAGLRAGIYLARGHGPAPGGLPRSEFGVVPTTGYVALSVFF